MQEFFENLFVPSVGLSLTVGSMLITMLFAILIGVIIAGGYMLVNRRDRVLVLLCDGAACASPPLSQS